MACQSLQTCLTSESGLANPNHLPPCLQIGTNFYGKLNSSPVPVQPRVFIFKGNVFVCAHTAAFIPKAIQLEYQNSHWATRRGAGSCRASFKRRLRSEAVCRSLLLVQAADRQADPGELHAVYAPTFPTITRVREPGHDSLLTPPGFGACDPDSALSAAP